MVSVVSWIPTGDNFIFVETFWDHSMSILHNTARNVRFVLFAKTSNVQKYSQHGENFMDNILTKNFTQPDSKLSWISLLKDKKILQIS